MVLGFTGQRYCSDRPTIRQHQVKSLLASKQEISDVKSKWILLVEDEDSLRNAVGKFLAKEGGFNVTGVSDAQSALLVCRGLVHTTKRTPHIIINDTNSTSNSTIRVPDCVVLDIQLNGPINGLDLLKIIRADSLLENLPVILLTAKGRVEDRVLGYNSGADAYLPKPFDPEELLSILNSIMSNMSSGATRSTITRDGKVAANQAYRDLKRELVEIKALLNEVTGQQPSSSQQSEVSVDSIRRDILEMKDIIKSGKVGNESSSQTSKDNNQYDTSSILTPDETSIINFVSQGMRNKDIASKMDCSISKIEKRISAMFKKADVHKREDLIQWWHTYSETLDDGDENAINTTTLDPVGTETSDDTAAQKDGKLPLLTEDEREVIELLESGMTTQEIISTTSSSKSKLTKLLDILYKKCGVKNRTELARWWREN